jgi:hypothetical protein
MDAEFGTLEEHKLSSMQFGSSKVEHLPKRTKGDCFKYFVDVYVDDFIAVGSNWSM